MDLGNTGNIIAQIGVAAVGAYFGAYTGIGAYTGMQIGLSVGSLLFQAKEAKQHMPFNESLKGTNSYVKPDPVPLLIGTDICPGNVIWLNENTMGMVRPGYYDNGALDHWLNSLHRDAREAVKLFHIEFIASFSNRFYFYEGGIGRFWLNDTHFWAWLRFDDWIHYYNHWINKTYGSWTNITDVSLNLSRTLTWHNANYLTKTHVKSIKAIRWWGAMMIPSPTPMDEQTLDVFDSLSGKDNDSGKALALIHQGPPQQFPSLKAEVSNVSQFSTGYEYTLTPFAGDSGDRRHRGYSHTFRDNKSHYMYGVFQATGGSIINEPYYYKLVSIRRLNFYPYTYTLLAEHEYVWNNITIGYSSDMSLSRQDIDENPDHLYIFHGRNFSDGGTTAHHHADYSLEYDIFYIDRSDDTVHSVCYRNQLSINDGDDENSGNINPMVLIRSMEVLEDYILLFGYEYQTHAIWSEQRTLTANAEYLAGRKTKIYINLSKYPNNYWADDIGNVGVWAWFSNYPRGTTLGLNSRERYRIIEQTSTYIIVDGWYAQAPLQGDTVYIHRVRNQQAGWGIVGEGSNKNTIYVNVPSPTNPGPRITTNPFDYNVVRMGSNTSWKLISSADNTSISFSTPLTNNPIPGEIIWFSFNAGIEYQQIYTNPYDYWSRENLIPKMCAMWTGYGSHPGVCFQYIDTPWYFNMMWNTGMYGKMCILKLDKHTGNFISKIYDHDFFPYRYTGVQFIVVAETGAITTTSTDAQIGVSFMHVQPYAKGNNNNLIINKSDLSISSDWFEFIGLKGKIFAGSVKVRAWDDYTKQYSNRWYALIYELNARYGTAGTSDWAKGFDDENVGFYLCDLGETGIFPVVDEPLSPTGAEEYSALLNLDANSPGMIKWFRPQARTGGVLNNPYWIHSSLRDSPHIRITDYDEKVFFNIDRGRMFYATLVETWCFHMPNEYNKYGFSWPVFSSTKNWAVSGGNALGNPIKSCKYTLEYFSNFCDCYLSTTISKLFQQVPNTFSKPTVQSASSVYANELIEDKVLYAGKEHEIFEPRFMFSMCWSQKKPLVDMLREVLATCQGMYVTQCDSSYSGYIKLPMPNEVPDWYFGHEESNFISNANSSYTNIIYIDLSDYPDDYWRGDFGTITRNGVSYNFTVKKQYVNYIELETNLDITPRIDDEVLIIKDNMTEGSFAFSKKPQYERANKIRIEFINRLMEYKIDIAEADDIYKQEILDKRIITKQLELHGIKRATQAARMAYRYLDYEQYVNWMCSFQTDIMGHYVCYGDIIGITHPVTGWFAKPFRVLRKEELDDFNVILECEEYVGSIYHDVSNPVYQGGGRGSVGPTLPISDIPDPVRRLKAFYDPITNTIYVTYSAPRNSAFFTGVNIYYSVDGGEYIRAGFSSTPVASVIYSEYPGTTTPSSMEPTRTKYGEMEDADYRYAEIPYDPLTMIGTFPASGYLWINNELVYYGAIDTVNNKFTHVIRNIDTPEYQYAADAPDDGYNWTNPLIVLADPSNTFGFQFDTSLVDLTDEALQTEGSQIEYHVPTITIRADSLNIMGLSGFSGLSPTYSFQLRYPMGRPYSPTLLRYVRDL